VSWNTNSTGETAAVRSFRRGIKSEKRKYLAAAATTVTGG